LSIAGRIYRVASSADERTLTRVATVVEAKLRSLGPHVVNHPNGWLLVALSLAHDLELQSGAMDELKRNGLSAVRDMLERVDTALGHVDENGHPLRDTTP
jgi:cell division protein ZapA (FtsZ GTPase activity inhibitor)